MKKQDCRVGMVVNDRVGKVRGVVVKCNPKNVRMRTIDADRDGDKDAIWNIPYSHVEPVVTASLSTEMVMRSFEDPDNEGVKTYIAARKDEPLDYPDGSPEHHILRAICELWRKLDDENLDRECREAIEAEALKPGPKRRPATIMREINLRYSEMINKLFSALGREVSRLQAERWEKDRKQETGRIPS